MIDSKLEGMIRLNSSEHDIEEADTNTLIARLNALDEALSALTDAQARIVADNLAGLGENIPPSKTNALSFGFTMPVATILAARVHPSALSSAVYLRMSAGGKTK